ncbi:radical SAM protein [Candidatus Woesearchaeota archaeon]|nr:radical SAM protein [Candidatus Woesearchaeota archaeon]
MIPNKLKLIKSISSNILLKKPIPFILLFEPSQMCNCKCTFCYHWKEDHKNELTTDEINRVLKEAYKLGCGYLLFNGGEPFVNSHVEYIIKTAYNIGYDISITTNGYLLMDNIEKYGRYIDSITVSIDYPDNRHDIDRKLPGLFDRAIAGIKETKKYVKNIRINYNIHQKNYKDIRKICEIAKELGVQVYFRFLISEVDNLDDWLIKDKELINKIILEIKDLKKRYPIITSDIVLDYTYTKKNFKCLASTFIMNIDSMGRVYNSCLLHENKKDSIFGNIRENSLKEIWYSELARDIRGINYKCIPKFDCYASCIIEPSLLLKPDFKYWREYIFGNTVGSFFKKIK